TLPRPLTPQQPPPVDATALIRGMFSADAQRPAPGLGTLPADWLDAGMLQTALRRVMTPGGRAAQGAGAGAESHLHYGEPAGHARPRHALAPQAARLAAARTLPR